MPTYEYECRECGHRFDKFQSMTAPQLEKCPECGGRLKRLIGTGAGIIFKGHGFYATDYGASSSASRGPSCGRDSPCCGRGTPCGKHDG